MPTYMTQFAYTTEAWAALLDRPEDRSQVLAAHLEQFGERLLGFYYAFSAYDGVVSYEVSNETAATAAMMSIAALGHDKAIHTTQLLTVAQAIEAMR